jgi:hypothetical protein
MVTHVAMAGCSLLQFEGGAQSMIIEIVIQKLPDMHDDELRDFARTTVARWQNNPELVRKYYGRTEGGDGVGVYIWPSREAAQRGHDAAWCADVERRTGAPPVIQYFDLFMLVDNQNGRIADFPMSARAGASATGA